MCESVQITSRLHILSISMPRVCFRLIQSWLAGHSRDYLSILKVIFRVAKWRFLMHFDVSHGKYHGPWSLEHGVSITKAHI